VSRLIERNTALESISSAFQVHPVVAVLGPRQCGKTTLCKEFLKTFEGPVQTFDLEDPEDLAKLERPKLALQNLEGLVVIDEIQKVEELFPLLRVLVDRENFNTKFLILGSASRELIKQSSESLAGRIQYIELSPLKLNEVGYQKNTELWVRGGFPLSFLAKSDVESQQWRQAFISTFLERDIPNLGINIPAKTLRRFWTMLAHYHGQTINYAELARSIQTTDSSIRRYLDILEGTFMVRLLHPWFENIKKRQVKSSKVFIRDSGILHSLLSLKDYNEILGHPKCGASWEGYCLEEIIRKYPNAEKHFWAIHSGAELDLLIEENGKRIGFEIKFSSSPKTTKSMYQAIKTLSLDKLTVVTPGKSAFPLDENIQAVGLEKLLAE